MGFGGFEGCCGLYRLDVIQKVTQRGEPYERIAWANMRALRVGTQGGVGNMREEGRRGTCSTTCVVMAGDPTV